MKLADFGKNFIFMPDATKGAVRSITTEQLKATGTEALVTNTLHMLISAGSGKIEQLGGMHKFMNWDSIILTDSGGFQVFSLIHTGKWQGKVHENGATFKSPKDGTVYELTPERSIDIQIQLGSDILVVLDDCRKATTTRAEAEESVARTIEWAGRCKRHFENKYGGTAKTGKLLTAVVQGANFIDLREKCAAALVELGFDGYNFGGYVLDDEGKLVVKEMECVIKNTPRDKFNYAMGVGKPEDIFAAGKLGYQVFDTVLPTRNARHGSLYVTEKAGEALHIKNSQYATDTSPIDKYCDCETCKHHSRAYLHHLLRNEEMTGYALATIHNLRFFQRVIEKMNAYSASLPSTYRDFLELMKF